MLVARVTVRHAAGAFFQFRRGWRGDYLITDASPRDVTDDPPGDDWMSAYIVGRADLSLPTVLEAYMYGRDPTWEEARAGSRPFAGQPTESAKSR